MAARTAVGSAGAHPGRESARDRQRRKDRRLAIASTIVPLAGAFAAVLALALGLRIGWPEIVLTLVLYVATTAGLEIGFHRLFSHRSFETTPLVRSVFAVLGCMAFQGPPIWWAAIHRRHHAYSDTERDPHSAEPLGPGLRGRLAGMVNAHWGWLFSPEKARPEGWERSVRDLYRDPAVFRIHMTYGYWLVFGLVLPALICGLVTWSVAGLLSGLLWGGFFRLFLADASIRGINSLAHNIGWQDHDSRDRSTNNVWLAIPSLGAGWHNNHHANPRSATTSMKWWQLDPSGWIIRGLEICGLAWNVRRTNLVTEEKAS